MKIYKKNILIFLVFSCFLLQAARGFPEENNGDDLGNLFEDVNELDIRSNSWKVDIKKSAVSFIGDVKVTADSMEMNCQSLTLYFKKPQKGASSKNKQPPVDKFHATGSVRINIPDMGNAAAEDAVYERDSRQIILTGNPVGKYYMDDRLYEIPGGVGKIIYDLKEKTISVESAENEQAELSISGKEKKQ